MSFLVFAHRHSKSDVTLVRSAIKKRAIQKETEILPFVELLKSRPLQVVVEIGTAWGGAFWLWCRLAAPDALLVSLDLPGTFAGGGGSADEVLPVLASYGEEDQQLRFVRDDSHSQSAMAQLVEILDGRLIDFLFIDGDHSYEGVRADFELYSPLVREGGIIALHDILPQEESQVDVYWADIKHQYRFHEFADRGDNRGAGNWGGIGAIEWSAKGSGSSQANDPLAGPLAAG